MDAKELSLVGTWNLGDNKGTAGLKYLSESAVDIATIYIPHECPYSSLHSFLADLQTPK